mmetsp:Transcript_62147/g.92144  ORF Transcript_62147/g.92144 Transcript_62147/m.92144 type:complete len:89 (-) Transcript_62147:146-412(-)
MDWFDVDVNDGDNNDIVFCDNGIDDDDASSAVVGVEDKDEDGIVGQKWLLPKLVTIQVAFQTCKILSRHFVVLSEVIVADVTFFSREE